MFGTLCSRVTGQQKADAAWGKHYHVIQLMKRQRFELEEMWAGLRSLSLAAWRERAASGRARCDVAEASTWRKP